MNPNLPMGQNPQMASPQDDGPEENVLCFPIAALAVAGDDNSTTPAEGDEVEFKSKGVVTKVEGDKVYVSVQTANDQPVEGSESEEGSESPEAETAEETDLKGKAGQVDQMSL